MTERDEILRVANLAKLAFEPEHLDAFAEEFSSIITLVEDLQEVDTTGVEPTYHGNANLNVFRDDVTHLETKREDFLENVKTSKDGYIQVPAIIESEGA